MTRSPNDPDAYRVLAALRELGTGGLIHGMTAEVVKDMTKELEAALALTQARVAQVEAERDRIGKSLVAGLDADAALQGRHAPSGLSNEEARAWYHGYDARIDVRNDPVPLAQTPLGLALTETEADRDRLREALDARPIVSKYCMKDGFDENRFFADYENFSARARAALSSK